MAEPLATLPFGGASWPEETNVTEKAAGERPEFDFGEFSSRLITFLLFLAAFVFFLGPCFSLYKIAEVNG